METNAKLLPAQRENLDNPDRYQRLAGKLKYLIADLTSLLQLVR